MVPQRYFDFTSQFEPILIYYTLGGMEKYLNRKYSLTKSENFGQYKKELGKISSTLIFRSANRGPVAKGGPGGATPPNRLLRPVRHVHFNGE